MTNSNMSVQSYLFFNGRCEEALEFYGNTVGAKVEMISRFKDAPPGMAQPGMENKVMHASFRIGETVRSMSRSCAGVLETIGTGSTRTDLVPVIAVMTSGR